MVAAPRSSANRRETRSFVSETRALLNLSGSCLNFPMKEQEVRARSSNIPHRAHLGAVRRPARESKRRPPVGCLRARIPDRVVFEKLVQILMFGCAYEKVADKGCLATTLRRRRNEWIGAGVVDALRKMALEAYDRVIG